MPVLLYALTLVPEASELYNRCGGERGPEGADTMILKLELRFLWSKQCHRCYERQHCREQANLVAGRHIRV